MTDLSEGDEVLVHGAQPLSEVFCDVCSEDQGRRIRVDGVFTDSVTGRSFCTECAGAYISWLLDGGVVDHPELREVYEGSDDG